MLGLDVENEAKEAECQLINVLGEGNKLGDLVSGCTAVTFSAVYPSPRRSYSPLFYAE
jgi:hypothetical protein